MTKCTCDNCGKTWPEKKLQPVRDIFRRVEPGGVMPAGECPECGALCYPPIPPRPAEVFVLTVAAMKTEEEYGEDCPPSEDWISTLNELIAEARKIAEGGE